MPPSLPHLQPIPGVELWYKCPKHGRLGRADQEGRPPVLQFMSSAGEAIVVCGICYLEFVKANCSLVEIEKAPAIILPRPGHGGLKL